MTNKFSTLLLLFLCITLQTVQAQKPRTVIEKMLQSVGNIESLSYEFVQKERMLDRMNYAKVRTKMTLYPKKIYVLTLEPDEDIELLWIEGKYDGKALIKPNGFPYINVKLHPTSDHLLGLQHHPVTDSGFGKFAEVLQKTIDEEGSNFDNICTLAGSTTFDNQDCYIVEMNDPDFKFVDYTVKKGEDLFDIAKRYNITEYMIMAKNQDKGIDNYFDVKEGQKLQIPTSFCKKTTIYITKDDYLPLFWKMEDNEGLFEQYEFSNVKINPQFDPAEFTEDYEAYGF